MVDGYVYLDNNYNNVFDAVDTGEVNITILLMTSTGLVLLTGQTDGNGYYLFTGLVNSGDYLVAYSPVDPDLIGSPDSSQRENGNQAPPVFHVHIVASMDFDDSASLNNNFGLILPPTPPTPPGG